jgi:hypothetical protein
MAVARSARARHPRLDQTAVPRRPRPRMGAQAAALSPASPIRTNQPPRPPANAASRQRLAVGRAARRRVRAAASAPSRDRLTTTPPAPPTDDHPRDTPGRQPAPKPPPKPTSPRSHATEPHQTSTHEPNNHHQHLPSAPLDRIKRLLQAARFQALLQDRGWGERRSSATTPAAADRRDRFVAEAITRSATTGNGKRSSRVLDVGRSEATDPDDGPAAASRWR